MKSFKTLQNEINIGKQKRPPATKKVQLYGSEISGLKNAKCRPFTAKPQVSGGKLVYRVTDEFGSFTTLNLKAFAKMFG